MAAQRRAPRGVLTVTRKITGCPLPSLEEPLSSHYYRNAQSILKEPSQPNTAASACAVALRLTFQNHKSCDKIHQETVFPQKLQLHQIIKQENLSLCVFISSIYAHFLFTYWALTLCDFKSIYGWKRLHSPVSVFPFYSVSFPGHCGSFTRAPTFTEKLPQLLREEPATDSSRLVELLPAYKLLISLSSLCLIHTDLMFDKLH